MRNIVSLLFLFQVFIAVPTYSNINDIGEDSTRIYLKPNGREMISGIKEVTYYGLILEDNQTLSYRVIPRITTDQEWIIDAIQNYVDSTEKYSTGNLYSLNMQNASYELPHYESTPEVLTDETAHFNLMSNRAENFEFGFSFTSDYVKGFYFQMNYTVGKYVSGYSYCLSAISFGISKQIKLNSGELYFGVFHGGKSLYVSLPKLFDATLFSQRATVTYLELMYRNSIFSDKRFVLSIGSKGYFDNMDFLNTKTTFGFSVGIAYRLTVL